MESVRERWQQQYTDKQSSVEWWDSLAEDFAAHELPNEDSSLAMRIIARENILCENARVLDVGCGPGRYSVALAKQGATVRGTDISPKMIGFAEKAATGYSGISFHIDD